MRKTLSKIIRTIIPYIVLSFIFPSKFPREKPIEKYFDKFIRIKDEIAENDIKLFLRRDAFLEIKLFSCGLYGNWEKESLKIWSTLSKQAKTIIDVGANTGIYSILSKNNNRKANVIAIEPIAENYTILNKNCKKNRFSICIEKIALSDEEGTAKMYMLKNKINYMTSVNSDRYALISENYNKEETDTDEKIEIEIELKPFSYIYEKNKLTDVNLIKIDVEGHELNVVKSMIPYLKRHRPAILIEIIGHDTAEELDSIFSEIGYQKYISIDEINKSHVVKRLCDNDHHNFLICDENTVVYLQTKGLVL